MDPCSLGQKGSLQVNWDKSNFILVGKQLAGANMEELGTLLEQGQVVKFHTPLQNFGSLIPCWETMQEKLIGVPLGQP